MSHSTASFSNLSTLGTSKSDESPFSIDGCSLRHQQVILAVFLNGRTPSYDGCHFFHQRFSSVDEETPTGLEDMCPSDITYCRLWSMQPSLSVDNYHWNLSAAYGSYTFLALPRTGSGGKPSVQSGTQLCKEASPQYRGTNEPAPFIEQVDPVAFSQHVPHLFVDCSTRMESQSKHSPPCSYESLNLFTHKTASCNIPSSLLEQYGKSGTEPAFPAIYQRRSIPIIMTELEGGMVAGPRPLSSIETCVTGRRIRKSDETLKLMERSIEKGRRTVQLATSLSSPLFSRRTNSFETPIVSTCHIDSPATSPCQINKQKLIVEEEDYSPQIEHPYPDALNSPPIIQINSEAIDPVHPSSALCPQLPFKNLSPRHESIDTKFHPSVLPYSPSVNYPSPISPCSLSALAASQPSWDISAIQSGASTAPSSECDELFCHHDSDLKSSSKELNNVALQPAILLQSPSDVNSRPWNSNSTDSGRNHHPFYCWASPVTVVNITDVLSNISRARLVSVLPRRSIFYPHVNKRRDTEKMHRTGTRRILNHNIRHQTRWISSIQSTGFQRPRSFYHHPFTVFYNACSSRPFHTRELIINQITLSTVQQSRICQCFLSSKACRRHSNLLSVTSSGVTINLNRVMRRGDGQLCGTLSVVLPPCRQRTPHDDRIDFVSNRTSGKTIKAAEHRVLIGESRISEMVHDTANEITELQTSCNLHRSLLISPPPLSTTDHGCPVKQKPKIPTMDVATAGSRMSALVLGHTQRLDAFRSLPSSVKCRNYESQILSAVQVHPFIIK